MTEEAEPKPTSGEEQEASETEAGSPDAARPEGPGDGPGMPPEPAGEDAPPDYPALAVELNDKLLRAVAELENYRRRAEKERQDTAKFVA
jgi:molecular chaperone GrpE